jgi:hypothetical protein
MDITKKSGALVELIYKYLLQSRRDKEELSSNLELGTT